MFEGLELITFTRSSQTLYLAASEQLWLPEEWPPVPGRLPWGSMYGKISKW